ncbi:MAG: Rrf2 family transcriptional regulator [Thermoguttaceae bacterium]
MKLSQSVAYAIQAALRLAEEPTASPISCCQLAATGRMPERFLLQILRDMTKQGILHSTRGGGGGFMLGRQADEISLLDMIEAVDGPLGAALPGKGAFPEESADRLQEALKRIAAQVRSQLASIKLSDLMNRPSRSGEPAPTAALPPIVGPLFDYSQPTGLMAGASQTSSL